MVREKKASKTSKPSRAKRWMPLTIKGCEHKLDHIRRVIKFHKDAINNIESWQGAQLSNKEFSSKMEKAKEDLLDARLSDVGDLLAAAGVGALGGVGAAMGGASDMSTQLFPKVVGSGAAGVADGTMGMWIYDKFQSRSEYKDLQKQQINALKLLKENPEAVEQIKNYLEDEKMWYKVHLDALTKHYTKKLLKSTK